MTPAPDERDRIRAAMDRILADAPERSNGALTIVALALEADVPRNALTQRHLDLKNEFYERVRERGGTPDAEIRLRATVAKLKQTIASKNEELSQLRADVPALVRAVHQLILENQQLRDMHANPGASIIPFPGREPVRPRDLRPQRAHLERDRLRAGHQPRRGPSAVRPRIPGRRPEMALRSLAEDPWPSVRPSSSTR